MTVFRTTNWIIVLILLVSCQSKEVDYNKKASALAKVTDFRGIEFKSPPEANMINARDITVEQLHKHGFDKIDVFYSPSDSLEIGEEKLIQIQYRYYQNKLYLIELISNDNNRCTKAKYLKEALEQKYKVALKVMYSPETPYSYSASSKLANLTLDVICIVGGTSVFIADPVIESNANQYIESAELYIKRKELIDAADDL